MRKGESQLPYSVESCRAACQPDEFLSTTFKSYTECESRAYTSKPTVNYEIPRMDFKESIVLNCIDRYVAQPDNNLQPEASRLYD
jgi:hypothetical protein